MKTVKKDINIILFGIAQYGTLWYGLYPLLRKKSTISYGTVIWVILILPSANKKALAIGYQILVFY